MVKRQTYLNHGWPGLHVLLASFVCALALPVPGQAQSFDERRNLGRGDSEDAVLGTFHLNNRGANDDHVERRRRARNELKTTPRNTRTYSTIDLVHMFADARAARDEGNIDEAKRLFERLIAIRPDSELADKARRDLATLDYNPDRQITKRSREIPAIARRVPTPPDSSGEVYGPARPAARQQLGPTQPPRMGKVRKQRSRRLVMLERQFIADVGDRIFFAKGSADLGARAIAVLEAQADWLKTHPDIVVTIKGYADDGQASTSALHNLSLARAEAVRQRLLREGIPEARIASLGRGRLDPVAVCAGSSCAAQNRRVVTVISSGPIRIVGDSKELFGDKLSKPRFAPQTNSRALESRVPGSPRPPLRALR